MADYRERKDYRDYYEERQLVRRMRVVWAAFAALFVLYAGHFWYLQVVRSGDYRELAENNRIRYVAVQPLRGMIYDRHGRLMVKNRVSFNVLLNRDKVSQDEGLLARLARDLGMDVPVLRERWRAHLRRPPFEPVILKEDVDLAEVAYLEARREDFPEVNIGVEPKRQYPLGTVSAHLLGYLGEVSESEMARGEASDAGFGDLVGKAGVELAYDGLLRGRKGLRPVMVNSRGRLIRELELEQQPVPGESLTLSVDLDMQRELAAAFLDNVGAAVFLDARTSEVLALESRPAYDPNEFATHFSLERWEALMSDRQHPLQNRAVQSKYSPGSTFKVVVALAALEEKVITPQTSYWCPGYVMLYRRRFNCHKEGGHGLVDLHQALQHSCNVYFYQVGKEVGIDKIAEYARRLGYGVKTGMDLPREEAGLVPTQEWKQRTTGQPWFPGETISVAIGQGPVLVTPVQMARLMQMLATGEVPPPPRTRLVDPPPPLAAAPSPVGARPESLRVIRTALRDVVNNWGTGARARLADVEVCGKTGTVQVVAASAGVDSKKLAKEVRDHSWFAGWAPCADPQIAFAVFVEHGGHGGDSAAPIARRVLEVHFNKLRAASETKTAAARGAQGEQIAQSQRPPAP
ncbi:MAG: penicillin-binding protein 2 [Gemmataceae bacterium]|nr:penicillin-binding protein 2 [Gemmataceae bacterium]